MTCEPFASMTIRCRLAWHAESAPTPSPPAAHRFERTDEAACAGARSRSRRPVRAANRPRRRYHRYESPEHEDLGDKSLDELQDFLKTDEGKKWAKDHGIDPIKLAAEIKADPLKKAGGKITAGRREVKGQGKEDVKLTPGEITALSGDFYKGPDEIASAASLPIEGANSPEKDPPKNELDKILEAIEKERKGALPDANKAYEEITKGRYLDLAKINDVHFAPKNRTEWRRLHDQAIGEAATAKDDRALQHALLVDASGGTFPDRRLCLGPLVRQGQVGRRHQTSSSDPSAAHGEPRSSDLCRHRYVERQRRSACAQKHP